MSEHTHVEFKALEHKLEELQNDLNHVQRITNKIKKMFSAIGEE